MTPNDLLAGGYRMGRQMIHGFCDDLTEAEFHHQPLLGANSAAWIVGHLAVTIRRTAERIGATDLPLLTEEVIARYSVTKKAAENQAELGSKAELLALLDVSVNKLIEALPALPANGLAGPAPNPGRFATNYGEARTLRRDAHDHARRANLDHPPQPRQITPGVIQAAAGITSHDESVRAEASMSRRALAGDWAAESSNFKTPPEGSNGVPSANTSARVAARPAAPSTTTWRSTSTTDSNSARSSDITKPPPPSSRSILLRA